MSEYDIIIKGGTIVDGTRVPRYISDLAVKDGKIAKIGGLRNAQAAKVLDASGLIVAPGFVDLHTHYDGQIQWDPYCTLSGWHGVTSLVIGNCGFGFAPCRPEDRERAMRAMSRVEAIPYEAMKAGMLWDWVTFPEFLNTIDLIPKGVNVVSYVPLTPLYTWVMGWGEAKSRRPTKAELGEICRLMNEAMDAGACGWSARVSPDSNHRDYDGTNLVTDLLTEDEILTFAQLLGDRDEGFMQMTYRPESGTRPGGEGDTELKFFERVAEVSGRPVLYQSVVANATNPARHREHLEWLADCARRRVRVYGQGATARGSREFTFEDWNMYDENVAWRDVTLGTVAERKQKMQDPQRRAALRADWDAGGRPGGGTRSVDALIVQEVQAPELQRYQGLRVREIAQQEGKHVVDAILDLVVADDLRTEFLQTRARDNPEYNAEILRSPHTVAGLSDGGAHTKFSTSGSYPTDALIWLVRDNPLVSLEEMHFKLSHLPAFLAGFRDRGFLREGSPADIVVYDLEGLKLSMPRVAHDFPGGEWRRVQTAEGYRWTLVNGQVTFEDGEPTGALPGKLLRHGLG